MASQKHSSRYRRLEVAVSQVQKRWGVCALRLVSQAATPLPTLTTGFSSLDAAIGLGAFFDLGRTFDADYAGRCGTVTVVKNKIGSSGGRAQIQIWFNGTVRGCNGAQNGETP